MKWQALARSWTGLLAAALAVAAGVWLLSVYVQAVRVTPVEKALVDSLKQKAKTDAEVQKVLQPEFDRQHLELVKRRNAYNRVGLLLLLAVGVFFAWYKWFRPAAGEWTGFPARIAEALERARPQPPERPMPGRVFPLPLARRQAGNLSAEVDLTLVDDILQTEGRRPDAAIPILQAIQSRYRYLPDAALRKVCESTGITPSQIASVATFYGQFRQTPVGEHIIRVCEGTACHVSGAVDVGNEIRRCLGMADGTDTDAARQFTVERVACIGSCSLAPVITIGEKIYGKVSALSAGQVLRDYVEAQERARSDAAKRTNGHARGNPGRRRSEASVEIRIGLGSCGIASGALEVRTALENAVEEAGGGALVKVVGCAGLCHSEPLVEVIEGHRHALYGNVVPSEAQKIVREHVKPSGLAAKIRGQARKAKARLTDDSAWIPLLEQKVDATPYVQKQVRVVLENCGIIDPLSMEDYRKHEGMRALESCIGKIPPETVVELIRTAGLRGRGGAGFPTAVKWDLVRQASGTAKYVICNGDEGDPGAFMDRAVLEADPFRVIEGIVIAAYAVGASEGYVYVRREYPIAVRHIRAAIAAAEESGYLGDGILGTSFRFRLHVREGAGAFVCGEETALIQSIEGKRGMPRLRPPYPAQSGLWGEPTLINNVETLACVPWIVRRGPEAFAALGTERSKGTKVFSLAGKIKRGGLIEVPMGITIREIVEEIGGGLKQGRAFKAVLAGGPSGGCIPAALADTRIDYEELASTGSIMGSGGLVVLDDRDCAVDIARYFLHFTQNESCGKCTFCRVGTKRMLEILERICAGKGREQDLDTLDELSRYVRKGSLCGLGQTAPNPVITTLRYFREEYEAHVREKRCPAAACKDLIHYRVLDSCTGCTLCAQACPVAAIQARPYQKHEVADDVCTRCGMCVTACPENAIEVA
jgi:NADH-quinone oxidoreductase subunit F